MIRLNDSGATTDHPAGRKVRSRQHRHDFTDRCVGILDQHIDRIADFTEIVRRNRGRHTHGDSR